MATARPEAAMARNKRSVWMASCRCVRDGVDEAAEPALPAASLMAAAEAVISKYRDSSSLTSPGRRDIYEPGTTTG